MCALKHRDSAEPEAEQITARPETGAEEWSVEHVYVCVVNHILNTRNKQMR